jgi:hypothetical protein
MLHCDRTAIVPTGLRTRPLVRRVPGHNGHDRFTTRFPGPTVAGAGPVPPGTDPRATRTCSR